MDRPTEIRQMIADNLAVELADVVDEASLQDDLGGDSLLLLTLAEDIAERYGVEIVGDDLVEIANVGELLALVESRAAGS